ncbi:hypothetical protein JVU11DRAFT_6258 [Chiua virens]|nr:hypothetical protein JVU11DRAFT_6258 [Chiua virens]
MDYKELSPSDHAWMKADPAHPQNAQHFDWLLQNHLAPELLPLQANSRLKDVIIFYHNKALRDKLGKSTFCPGSIHYPDIWHEGHEPAIQFLTEEQVALLFNRSKRPASLYVSVAACFTFYPSSYLHTYVCLKGPPLAAPCPSHIANSHLDCPEARAILEAFADWSQAMEIPAIITALQQLFDDYFDLLFWLQVLNSLVFHKNAQMTVKQAWGLVIAAQHTAKLPLGFQQGSTEVGVVTHRKICQIQKVKEEVLFQGHMCVKLRRAGVVAHREVC